MIPVNKATDITYCLWERGWKILVYDMVFRWRGGGAVFGKRVQSKDYRKLIPVNTGGEGGSEDFGLSQGFQRERRGSSCGKKSTKGDNRKLIPVNMEEGGGRGS